MHERLKILREELKMTKKDFADSIGYKRTTYTELENGTNPVYDRHIKVICSIHNVNERWLRYGELPIFNEEDEYIAMYNSLIDKDKETLQYIIKRLYNKKSV